MSKTMVEIGSVKRWFLIQLTKLEEMTITSRFTGLYYFFTKLHFRIYYGKSLSKMVLSDNIEEVDRFAFAAHRHGNMVVSLLYKDSKNKKKLRAKAVEAFTKNFLLDKEV